MDQDKPPGADTPADEAVDETTRDGNEHTVNAFDVHPGMVISAGHHTEIHLVHVRRDPDSERVMIVGFEKGDVSNDAITLDLDYCDPVTWHTGQAA